ncbi:MFS transporter, partial [Francisella tularensis subsp. holarctica]|nr:MFS transporter [Francisella tularensis subsp. holarctica]
MPETSRRIEYKINYKTTLDKYLYYFKNRYFFIISLLSALFYVYSIGVYNMLPFVLHHLGIPVITN